jgi:sugar phosphate isomerase/epimerase
MTFPIYLATILIEPHRWSPGKPNAVKLSEWLPKLDPDLFQGLELFERHVRGVPAEELEAVRLSPVPPVIYNSYASLKEEDQPWREEVSALAGQLGCSMIKFNFGADPARADQEVTALRQWRKVTDPAIKLLCECHPGTIAEDPARARVLLDGVESSNLGAVVHPFLPGYDEIVDQFMTHLGPYLCHAHVQARDEKDFNKIISLRSVPELVEKRLTTLQQAGFDGSFSMEFAQGTCAPDENAEDLLEEAIKDAKLLRVLR